MCPHIDGLDIFISSDYGGNWLDLFITRTLLYILLHYFIIITCITQFTVTNNKHKKKNTQFYENLKTKYTKLKVNN